MFVGKYTRKVQRGGWLRFPKDWLPMVGDKRMIYVMLRPDKGKSLILITQDDVDRAVERIRGMEWSEETKKLVLTLGICMEQVKISADGRMQISTSFLAYAGIKNEAHFWGNAKTIILTN